MTTAEKSNNNPVLSVYLITLNEEANIERALASASWADEVILVDSGSTDRTVQIAREHGAKVYSEPFVSFVVQKNSALDRCHGEWALNLDADEEVTPELRTSIETVINNVGEKHGTYVVCRKTWYFGRWIRHCGWYPEYRCRLSKRGQARWVGDTVHEHLESTGSCGRLSGDLLHRPYRDLGTHLKRIDRYSSLFAEREINKGHRSSMFSIMFHPPWKFFRMYILKGGFLDCTPGLIASLMGAWYTFMKYARLYERARNT
jgi:(heptosyl)LPS beta-1,4-glucosyltransferase